MHLVLILIAVVAFVIIATSKFKLHPFITLLLAAYGTAIFAGMPFNNIAKTISDGFGEILGSIGLVIVLGTIIGTILEKSGAAITMAEAVIQVLGDKYPKLTMTVIGYFVSIPVFCDSGFVILNSLKRSLGKRLKVSAVGMSIALSTGLYSTHIFVPPTPGPIAAAGNLGLTNNLGLVIGLGAIVAAFTAAAGLFWASKGTKKLTCEDDIEVAESYESLKAQYGRLPSASKAFAPILVPIILICLASVANYPSHPLGEGMLQTTFQFLGAPLNALTVGLGLALTLIKGEKRISQLTDLISGGILACAPIILITGAGGAFGKVLAATEIGKYLGNVLSTFGIGVFMPFIVSAALKPDKSE